MPKKCLLILILRIFQKRGNSRFMSNIDIKNKNTEKIYANSSSNIFILTFLLNFLLKCIRQFNPINIHVYNCMTQKYDNDAPLLS